MYIIKKANNHTIRMIYEVNQHLCKWEIRVKFPNDQREHILYWRTDVIATGYDVPAKDQYDNLYYVKLNKTLLDVLWANGENIMYSGEANIVICEGTCGYYDDTPTGK